ncbi:MAG: DUF5703 domain-containing protein [Verrucomicrobiae bacterium]
MHNVIWNSPSPDSAGSMPLGNGDIGINVWVEPCGDLVFYIGKTDAWGEFGQLYKVGRVRVSLRVDGVPLLAGESFRWALRLEEGAIVVTADRGEARLWVDAHHPNIHLLARGPAGLVGEVKLEIWRTQRRELRGGEKHGLHTDSPYPVYHDADKLLDVPEHELAWCHHNESSSWASNLSMQGLDSLIGDEVDPLMHRAFGGVIRGVGLVKTAPDTLASERPCAVFATTVTVLTQRCPSLEEWLAAARKVSQETPSAVEEPAWNAHVGWWREFWARSAIEAGGSEAARKVSDGYALQRYINACSGRGEYPIKFNGSIFTADWRYPGEDYDADYRRWGPGYWHQNTRLPYWAMLCSGDFEMLRPYFEMYRRTLPAARERCRKFCGHEGAIFLETMTFWGGYLEHNYGWPGERDEALAGHLSQNQYIRYHNSSGLEVVHHALMFHRFTGDEGFLRETALPLAEAVLDYYDLHFPRRGGRLHLTPAQAIEQWWEVENPLPEIAGLMACLNDLLALPLGLVSAARRASWCRLLTELPPLPLRGDQLSFAPAEVVIGMRKNIENPELYAVFPYHLCGLDSADQAIGIRTFQQREFTHDDGWAQDGMQAALLGLTEDARKSVVRRFSLPSGYSRFPVFWGPNADWIPDQDHGGTAMHALQLMAMQSVGDEIRVLPAWPKDWDVEFKLHAPGKAAVECSFREGKVEGLSITPEDRGGYFRAGRTMTLPGTVEFAPDAPGQPLVT